MILDLQTQAQLSTIYNQQTRFYHDMNHMNWCLTQLKDWYDGNGAPKDSVTEFEKKCIELAVWFHDVVYNPYSKTNEEDSAATFMTWALDAHRSIPGMYYEDEYTHGSLGQGKSNILHGFHYTKLVEKMILLTKHHNATLENLSETEKVFLDIDMSILGADRGTYTWYVTSVRKEYGFTTDYDYMKYRMKFLQSALGRPRIFYSDYFYQKYEDRARENILFELKDWEHVKQILEAQKNMSRPKPVEVDSVKKRFGIEENQDKQVDEHLDMIEDELSKLENLLGFDS